MFYFIHVNTYYERVHVELFKIVVIARRLYALISLSPCVTIEVENSDSDRVFPSIRFGKIFTIFLRLYFNAQTGVSLTL